MNQNKSLSVSKLREQFLAFIRAITPYVPSKAEVLRLLPVAALLLIFGNGALASGVDDFGGKEVGGTLCTFSKSLANSVAVKGICAAVFVWGLLKWLPTRKDGTAEMAGGVIGFAIATKSTTVMGAFGIKC